jgi:transposase
MIDPYEPYLKARWEEGCTNGQQLYREIVEMGYPGSRSQVATLVAWLRREENGGKPQSLSAKGESLAPRKASMLLLRRAEQLSGDESTALAKLAEVHEDIAATAGFTERFVKIVRERRGAELAEWLSDAEASDVGEIRQFARRVRQDEAAVEAGCTLSYSNGQTEGQITKLKAIKRSIYGRAKFDLLRRRALYAA